MPFKRFHFAGNGNKMPAVEARYLHMRSHNQNAQTSVPGHEVGVNDVLCTEAENNRAIVKVAAGS